MYTPIWYQLLIDLLIVNCRVINVKSSGTPEGGPLGPTFPSAAMQTINAGELVWAVHFGSDRSSTVRDSVSLGWGGALTPDVLTPSTPTTQQGGLLWIATGLQSGRIRTWNARTGECLLSAVLCTGIV